MAATFSFGLPPSVGREGATQRAARLEGFLAEALKRPVVVRVASNYQALKSELIEGKLLAAWGPPYVCARVEAYGGRGLLRGVRNGNATYRSALVSLAARKILLGVSTGLRCAWVDPDSIGGYVLPVAWLKEHGFHGYRFIEKESFRGSYQGGIDAVLDGSADLAAVWAPSGPSTAPPPALAELARERAKELQVLGFTRDCPNDGVVLSPFASSADGALLERTMLSLSESETGRELLRGVFNAERFQSAPVGSYRALDSMVFGSAR